MNSQKKTYYEYNNTEMKWVNNGNYIKGTFGDITLNDKSKIASFDLDSTLIQPTGNKKFSDSDTDWEFYVKQIPDKIRKYNNDGYNIIIISNQKGIGTGKTNQDLWCNKLNKIATILNIPLLVYASLNDDAYRKPNTKIWDDCIKCDINNSFYCGDAGGLSVRKVNMDKQKILLPKDFSDSDLKFALNVGVKFIHRDELVYGVINNMVINYPVNFDTIKSGQYQFNPNHQEMIIMVGYPGSGKSYYSTNVICTNNQYKYINQDILKTASKCAKMCETELKNKNSVVIDNTNSSKKTRKTYIDIAKKYGVKIRCIQFITDISIAKHNNYYRNCTIGVKLVPDIAYNMYKKYYEDPDTAEGFYVVEQIDFTLDSNKIDINKYKKYYI